MERDPIDTTEFWKDRIEDAEMRGMLHRSVYIVNPQVWERISDVHQRICDELIKPTDKVLDAGCGYGRIASWFKKYTGVDFSQDFIDRAKATYPKKKFVQADFRVLPFKDKEFDWAICISIKEMYIGRKGQEAWQEIEQELKRVAKKVLILEYVNPEKYDVI